jgi:hypothetical protein
MSQAGSDGSKEGDADGRSERDTVGLEEGSLLGSEDETGYDVSFSACVLSRVGDTVGTTGVSNEGDADGRSEGDAVGLEEGSLLGSEDETGDDVSFSACVLCRVGDPVGTTDVGEYVVSTGGDKVGDSGLVGGSVSAGSGTGNNVGGGVPWPCSGCPMNGVDRSDEEDLEELVAMM